MEYIEVSAKNVDDAITEASIQLGTTSDQIEYEVIEKGSTGFLGLGSKDAVIRARVKSADEKVLEDAPVAEKNDIYPSAEIQETAPKKVHHKKEISEEDIEFAKNTASEFLHGLFENMNLEVKESFVFDEAEGILNIDLEGPEMGIIIGKRGQTLDSVQYLTNLAVNRKTDSYIRIKMDTEDYRSRREDTLVNLARNVAYKVKKTRRPVALESMNPYERRVIHSALSEDPEVVTHSEGEEPYRHVVVTLK